MSNSVKCPYCGEEKDDLLELFTGYSGDSSEITVECYRCYKKYIIIQSISVTYRTKPDPDFEEYLDRHPDMRMCLRRTSTTNEL